MKTATVKLPKARGQVTALAISDVMQLVTLADVRALFGRRKTEQQQRRLCPS